MPSTTPVSKLPYPLGTDLLADGDNAIANLATALDGSAWAALTPVAPFSGQLWWARRSNVVFVNLNLGSTAGTSNGQLITTLPSMGYPSIPAGGAILLFAGQAGGLIRTVYVEVTGAIKAGEGWANTNPFWGTFSFPAANPQP